jgi:hypothetical protein
VSTLERAGAKIFYGGVPHGTLDNAILYYEKSRSLMPNFILNYLSLATAYHKDDQIEKAIAVLKIMQNLPVSTEDDEKHKADALKLIKAWQ